MHTFILQDWITVRGNANTVIQSESDWLDLTPYQDLVFWIDVREVTGAAVTLTLQTSPTKDEAFFLSPAAGMLQMNALAAGTAAPQKVLMSAAATPVSRYCRWQLNSANAPFDATFRIMVSANAPGV